MNLLASTFAGSADSVARGPVSRFGARLVSTHRLLVLMAAATASMAQAHPGHATFEAGAAHLVTSPYHLAMGAGLALGLFIAARLVRQVWAKRLLFIAGFALVAGTGFALLR